jgi:hypothetical protein
VKALLERFHAGTAVLPQAVHLSIEVVDRRPTRRFRRPELFPVTQCSSNDFKMRISHSSLDIH